MSHTLSDEGKVKAKYPDAHIIDSRDEDGWRFVEVNLLASERFYLARGDVFEAEQEAWSDAANKIERSKP